MKKNELLTGARGFTLIETLFAAVVLSVGVIFITPALFKSMDVLRNISSRYEANFYLNNFITQTEQSLKAHKGLDARTQTGTWQSERNTYHYEVKFDAQDRLDRLFRLDMKVEWKDIKPNRISKSVYISQ